jgi:type III restriction enzyme
VLDLDEDKEAINSLANVIRMNNPLVVIDEGHKVQTSLAIEVTKALNPGFIIEYSATPRGGSNVLVDISAVDLKEEQMVKIPIVLESSVQWENALIRGIEKRKELEKETKKLKSEYIRPIVLIQAEPKSETRKTVTVDEVKEWLSKAKISEEEIAIKTSKINELEGVDLFSKKCPIKYIITINALAEGWDCSFAYVLVSLANVGAKIAVEQIIGRILRMPYAERKENEDLNRSYIFASAKNFQEAASQIISGLKENGYDSFDLIDGSKKEQKYEREVKRAFNKDLAVPMMSYEGGALSFEDLVGGDFELAKQDYQFDFDIHFDNDGRAIIDIQKDNEWIRGVQQSLNLRYQDRNVTEKELVEWLDKRLRFTLLSKKDKVVFLEKALDFQLKKRTLTELSVNRYILVEKLGEHIQNVLEKYAKKKFEDLVDKGKITTKALAKFPETIILSNKIPQNYKKNYYKELDKLNGEEKSFIDRLDLDRLPNIEFWVRNREKVDPFYIQGWRKGKFYPDFVAVTKQENIVALEWKGKDRLDNPDTIYKTEIAKEWGKLGKGKLHFFLVHNGNVEEVLSKIKKL